MLIESESWNKIAQCVKRTMMFNTSVEDILYPTSHKKAFVGNRIELETLRRGYYISEDNFFTKMSAIAVRKTFCCKSVLDEIIHKISAAGILDKFRSDEIFYSSRRLNKPKVQEMDCIKKLSLEDLSGAFAILAFGHISAFIILVFELHVGLG